MTIVAAESARMIEPVDEGRLRRGVSIVIPTYRREQVLLDSLYSLLALNPAPDEIIVVDQTSHHLDETEAHLGRLHETECIRWIRLPEPSITHAMNVGLNEARCQTVLFLDDDIVPDAGLVLEHAIAQEHAPLVAGQVLQPGESPLKLGSGEHFRFNSTDAGWTDEFIGCNFSVNRDRAISIGGFDENFVGAAYRYEADFAYRFASAFNKVWFEPKAKLRHLRASSGGTRAHGHHLRTMSPSHSVGAYYYLLRTRNSGWWMQLIWRPLRAVRSRHHLRRPWWIPLTLLAELRGFLFALRLLRGGPKLIAPLSMGRS